MAQFGCRTWRGSHFLTYTSLHVYRMENHLSMRPLNTGQYISKQHPRKYCSFVFMLFKFSKLIRSECGFFYWENILIVSVSFIHQPLLSMSPVRNMLNSLGCP